jgi:hypothetical protein
MVRYTVEQCVFLHESYVKCGSARKCWRIFCHKFPGIAVSSRTGIHELINKVRCTGSLLDKKPAKKMLDEIRARLEHTTEITETPCTRDWHLEIVSSQSDKAVNFNLFKWYRECVHVQGHNFQHLL